MSKVLLALFSVRNDALDPTLAGNQLGLLTHEEKEGRLFLLGVVSKRATIFPKLRNVPSLETENQSFMVN